MAHHHDAFAVLILRTPSGYLTKTGTTEDICAADIIVLTLPQTGGYWASKNHKIAKFLANSSKRIEEINKDDYSLLAYNCNCCNDCTPNNKFCKFWTDRANANFQEFF